MKALTKIIVATAAIGVLGVGGIAKAVPLSHYHRDTIQRVFQVGDRQITRSEETPDAMNDHESEVNDDKVPASLSQVGEYGEVAYDLAKISNWTKATANLTSLQNAAKNLRQDIDNKQTLQLDKSIATLSQAVKTKNRQAAMRDANQVTLNAAKITEEFKGKVPVEITMLDYYGRELEIWAAQGNTTKLKATAKDIQQTWKKVRPVIEAHKGSAQVRKFNYLVNSVVAAKLPADYGRLSTPILNDVDNLEKVFQ